MSKRRAQNWLQATRRKVQKTARALSRLGHQARIALVGRKTRHRKIRHRQTR